MNEKNSALSDFIQHKAIVEKYLKDQQESKFKDLYPKYNNKDIENINLWIKTSKS